MAHLKTSLQPNPSGTRSSSGFPTAGTHTCIHEENNVANGVIATGVG